MSHVSCFVSSHHSLKQVAFSQPCHPSQQFELQYPSRLEPIPDGSSFATPPRPPKKPNIGNGKSTMNEDMFPIFPLNKGGFFYCHVSYRE